MKTSVLTLQLKDWPELDQGLWCLAQQPAGFLQPPRPASGWSPARRDIVTDAYGQWLRHLLDGGELDPHCTPGARVTEERLRAFLEELETRIAPVSAAMMIGALKRMLDVLDPHRDNTILGTLYANLKRAARPSRNKLSRMVPARQLFELGRDLMRTCEDGNRDLYVATRFRDGLLIAMLASCPVRLKNLTMIEIGRHLTFDGEGHRLSFEEHETKTGRPYVADLPGELDPWIERYLTIHRPRLMAETSTTETEAGAETAPWINRWGRPFSDKGVRMQIELRTKAAFGAAVWPHLFPGLRCHGTG